MSKRSSLESSKYVKNWGYNTRPRTMRDACILISKVDQRPCLLRIVTSKEGNRDIRDRKVASISNKVDILASSKEAITKVVINKIMARMMNWRSWL